MDNFGKINFAGAQTLYYARGYLANSLKRNDLDEQTKKYIKGISEAIESNWQSNLKRMGCEDCE